MEQAKNSVKTSEFRLILLFVLILVLNGFELDYSGLVFSMDIPQPLLDKLFAVTIGYGVIRQVKKKD